MLGRLARWEMDLEIKGKEDLNAALQAWAAGGRVESWAELKGQLDDLPTVTQLLGGGGILSTKARSLWVWSQSGRPFRHSQG